MGVLIILIGMMSMRLGVALDVLPCHFHDSINITDGIWSPKDETIEFNNVIYQKNEYGKIDYVLDNDMENVTVDPYIRGCICNIKRCLRLCCPLGTVNKRENRTTVCREHEKARDIQAKVLHENDKIEVVPLSRYFTYVEGHPCQFLYRDHDFQITHVRIIVFHTSFLFQVTEILFCRKGYREKIRK